MSSKAIDKLYRNLVKFSERPEWRDLFEGEWDSLFTAVGDELGVAPDTLDEMLQEPGLYDVIGSFVFESFLVAPITDEGSPAEIYRKRRARRESAGARKYLEGLIEAPLGIYEVTGVNPPRIQLRDWVDGGEPFRMHDKSASAALVEGDGMVARIVPLFDRRVLSAGVLRLAREEARELAEFLHDWRKERDAEVGIEERLDEESAFLPVWVIAAWLRSLIEGGPAVETPEGDPVLLGKAHAPLEADAETVAARLDAAEAWQREAPGEPAWAWFAEGGEDGTASLIAGAEIQGDRLQVMTLSRERMEQALERLRDVLGEAMGEPLVEYQSPESAVPDGPAQEAESLLDPTEQAAVIRQVLDEHYRKVIDEPVPVLDGRTPRQAVETEAGREQVVEWLKTLENAEWHRTRSEGGEPYDAGWMWRELGLEDRRD